MQKLGIDIGRVLIAPDAPNGRADTSFIGGTLADALATPPYLGMFDVVPSLVQRFEGRVWLVSKAGPRVQEKTRHWLRHHRFFERTGIPSVNLRFCLERAQKAGHCASLGITHFIDDRPDVLDHLEGVVTHRFLFGPQRKPVGSRGAEAVIDWQAAGQAVMARLGGPVTA
ncbi:hypothetical protein ACG02S_10495 [Roseateles sp. DC23W]|uniref:Uncharacterized protein n=1 Tax=Pelomonas dachongensis TaxID=3299029 RepID=A0ABW7ELI4_9BURK